MIKIIYEDNHLLVAEKPVNIPVMPDESNDKDLLTILKKDLKVRYKKPGNVYLGLVHRLDRPVGGVMVFAKTSKAASRLSQQIKDHSFIKEYHAIVHDNGIKNQDIFKDYLLKNPKTNIVKVTDDKNGKLAVLHYEKLADKDKLALVKIDLKTGRSHQIRVQFSSRNHALWGDQKYNKDAKANQQIALWATALTIIHPVSKENLTFKSTPPNSYPWNNFKEVFKW